MRTGQPSNPTAPAGGRSARNWLTWGIGIALLGAIAFHLSGTSGELANLRRLSIQLLVGTCVLQLLSQIFQNASMLLPLQTCMKGLGFWELYLVRTGGFFVGSLVPVAGGLAVRLAYLRNRGLTYLDFTWATLLSNVLALAAAAALAIGAAALLWMMTGALPASVLGVLAALVGMSGAALAAFQFLPWITRHPMFDKWRWLSGMRSLKASSGMAAWVFVLSLARHVFNFATFGLLYQSLTRDAAGFLTGGLVYALTSPVRMVNITPGNLGVTEWFVALVGRLLEFDLTTGLFVALAFRGVGVVAQILGALLGSAWLAAAGRPS